MKDRWVTFDCFGTLTDWNSGFRSILQTLAGDGVDQLVQTYHGLERINEANSPHRSYAEVLASSLEEAAELCGVSCDERSRNVIADSWETIRPFEDVETALESLRRSGFRLGILTNCDNDLFEKTHRQFQKRFDLVVTAETVMDYKPSLTHFRRFMRTTGATSKNWVHVACSWYHDIVPAAKLGVPCVWLDRDHTGEDPSYASARIESATELCAAVEQLSSASP